MGLPYFIVWDEATLFDEAECLVSLWDGQWQENPKRIERLLFGIEEE